jgi:SAM-dependent methyltransferase
MGNTLADNRHFWDNYDWSAAGDEWSGPWGSSSVLWHGTLMPRIGANLPAGTVLEIAPGSGRFTRFIKDQCTNYVGVDLSTTCVDLCKKRFASSPHMEFHVNDGLTLSAIADDSVDFVFSHDSLVHAEAEVLQSYLHELSRKLVVGGTGFLHFSNFLKIREKEAAMGGTPLINTHGRAENMSGDLFAIYCRDAGLSLLAMEYIDWGPRESDVLGYFARLPAGLTPAPKIVVNNDFMIEAGKLRQSWERFSRPAAPDPAAR